MHAQLAEQRLELRVEPLLRLDVARRVVEPDVPVAVEGDAVVGARKILGREPEVDRVERHLLERPRGRELRLARLLAAEHRRLRLADHLDVAEREVEVVGAEVEVVQAERLLEDRRVLLAREREHGLARVERVVAADLVGAVREAVRVPVVRGREEQLGAVGRAARDDHEVRRERLRRAVVLDDHPGDLGARVVRLELDRLRVRPQLDVVVLERRPHAEHLGVRLAVHRAGEAVAVHAADAGAVGHVRLEEPDPARSVKRAVARRREVVGELLDPRLVRDRRERIRRARRRLGRVLSARAVHLVQLLGLRVVRLEVVVGDRPRGRDPVVVAELAEVLLAQPVERGAVEFRRAADEVVHLRLEGFAAPVEPGVRRDVAVVDEHVLGEPVLRLARQPVAPLEQQDPLARGREVARKRAAAGAGANDDDVVRVHASTPPSSRGR